MGDYITAAEAIDPDRLERAEALAFWINLYNGGALMLAADAARRGADSVLRIPGGFRRPIATVAGEDLSLDAIEHAKLRRFRDPRIHAALVCGSVSCPTLRHEPYRGTGLAAQLDEQMQRTLAGGALQVDRQAGSVALSRIFLWYGADFARPERMPSLLPANRNRVLASLGPWIEPETRAWIETTRPTVEYQPYDWGLACAVQ